MFQIKNIKISLKITEIPLNSVLEHFQNTNVSYEIKSNYIIIKQKFIYVIFKSKNNFINHINITKIPDSINIRVSIEFFINIILENFKVHVLNYKIDNLTAIYDMKKEIDQNKLADKLKTSHIIKFNKEKFPGLFIKLEQGTFIIFHTGKVNLVGCQNPSHLVTLFKKLNGILL